MKLKPLLIIITIGVCSSCLRFPNSLEIIAKAEKEVLDGVTILQLYGSSYEMGYQYGTLMRSELKHSAALFNDFIQGDKDNVFRILVQKNKSYRRIRSEYKKLPAHFKDEIKGLRDGSGIRFGDAKMLACAHALINFGCSSFLVNTGDRILHARNFDYSPIEISEYPIIVHYHPDELNSYVSLGSCGYLGMHTGMNEYSISFSNNNSEGHDSNSESMSCMYASRHILETARNLDDVTEYAAEYTSDHGIVWIFSSYEDNDAVVIDYSPEEYAQSFLNGRTELALWNFFHDNKMRQKYNTLFSLENDYRPQAYKKIIDRHLPDTVEDIILLLADTSYYDYPFVPGASTINNASTRLSVVFDNEAGKIYYSFDGGYSGSGKYYLYDTATRTASEYMETSLDQDSAKIKKQTVIRSDRLFKHFLSNDFQELYSQKNTVYPVPYSRLRILTLFLDFPGIEPDTAQLERSVEMLRNEYPSLFEPVLLKAAIAAHRDDFEDAVSILTEYNEAYKELSPGDAFSLHYFLAKYADKAQELKIRKKSAETVISIYDEYRRSYNPNTDYFISDWEKYKNWTSGTID